MKAGTTYVTTPSGKRAVRCVTYALDGGGLLHIDKLIQPIQKPNENASRTTRRSGVKKRSVAGKPRSDA